MAKEVKVRRKKKRKWGNVIVISAFVTIMIAIITLSALYQSKPQPIQKEPADEYFTFWAEAYADATDETNRSIFITELHFTITAVGGNATNVLISPVQGYVSLEDYPFFEEIEQNQTEEVFLRYPSKVFSSRKDQGYPVYFDIACDKAEGRVTVYITEFFPAS